MMLLMVVSFAWVLCSLLCAWVRERVRLPKPYSTKRKSRGR